MANGRMKAWSEALVRKSLERTVSPPYLPYPDDMIPKKIASEDPKRAK